MVGIFWNIRGTNQIGKQQCLGGMIRDYSADFVCFSETKREVFPSGFWNALTPNRDFIWHHNPAMSTAGGILVGLDKDLFDVIGFVNRKYSIMATVTNKSDGFKWHLVVVYGPAYTELKMEFVSELHDIMEHASLPICIGRDFNLVGSQQDKKGGPINHNLVFIFNDWVNK